MGSYKSIILENKSVELVILTDGPEKVNEMGELYINNCVILDMDIVITVLLLKYCTKET
jgi:hypothetical protein